MYDLKHELLTAEEEKQLIENYQSTGSRQALDTLVKQNLLLVYKTAHSFNKKNSLEEDDLVQEGILGLMKAIRLFKLDKDFRLSTLAQRMIYNAMCQYAIDHSYSIRVPSHVYGLSKRLRDIRERLNIEERDDRPHILQQIIYEDKRANPQKAQALTVKSIKNLDTDFYYVCNINSENQNNSDDGEEFSVFDKISVQTPCTINNVLIDDQRSKILCHAKKVLNENEYYVFTRRYDLFRHDSLETLNQIAQDLGLTKSRVNQLEIQALDKLRHFMATA